MAELSVAMARGLHDAGILTVAKHYPGGSNPADIDSHMAESISYDTKEQLLNYDLYPYKRLMEEGLLDGLMTSHKRFINIDDQHPVTLSKKAQDIIRELGFNGVIVTDAMCMMGIKGKYGLVESKGLAVNAGVDLILHWQQDNKPDFDAVTESYEKGMIDEVMLDEAVKRVLAAQAKTMSEPKFTSLTDEDIKTFRSINKDCIYAKTDDGVPVSISRDGKHFFAVLVRNWAKLNAGGKMDVDTFTTDWHQPMKIEAKIKELFPNSEVNMIDQFPGPMQNARLLANSVGYDDVVFITFSEFMAYTGPEHLTRRIVNLIKAMQHAGKVSTIMHFGNPYVLEELGHTPRYIIGGQAEECAMAALEEIDLAVANMSLNNDVNLWVISDRETAATLGVESRVNDYMTDMLVTRDYVDSIYIFNDEYDVVYYQSVYTPFDEFKDRNWYDKYLGIDNYYAQSVSLRLKNDFYPQLITFVRPIYKNPMSEKAGLVYWNPLSL